MKKSSKGFTLIELMIVVVVVAVLLTIAVPAYQDSVRSARRSDAMAALGDGQMRQEKFRSNCPRYAAGMSADSDDADCNAASATFIMLLDPESPEGFYTLSVQDADANGYTLRATGKNGQETDQRGGLDCRFIQVNQDGVYTPAGCVKR